MKKFGQIMKDMGFNPNASPSSKAAFVKYLAKQAYNVDLEVPEIYQAEEESGEATLDSFLNSKKESNVKSLFGGKKKSTQEQLEFSFDELKKAD